MLEFFFMSAQIIEYLFLLFLLQIYLLFTSSYCFYYKYNSYLLSYAFENWNSCID